MRRESINESGSDLLCHGFLRKFVHRFFSGYQLPANKSCVYRKQSSPPLLFDRVFALTGKKRPRCCGELCAT